MSCFSSVNPTSYTTSVNWEKLSEEMETAWENSYQSLCQNVNSSVSIRYQMSAILSISMLLEYSRWSTCSISKHCSPIHLKPPLNTGADKKFYTLGKPPFYNIMNQTNTEHIKHNLIFVASMYHQHTAGTLPSKPTTSALTLCDHSSGYLFIKHTPGVAYSGIWQEAAANGASLLVMQPRCSG